MHFLQLLQHCSWGSGRMHLLLLLLLATRLFLHFYRLLLQLLKLLCERSIVKSIIWTRYMHMHVHQFSSKYCTYTLFPVVALNPFDSRLIKGMQLLLLLQLRPLQHLLKNHADACFALFDADDHHQKTNWWSLGSDNGLHCLNEESF